MKCLAVYEIGRGSVQNVPSALVVIITMEQTLLRMESDVRRSGNAICPIKICISEFLANINGNGPALSEIIHEGRQRLILSRLFFFVFFLPRMTFIRLAEKWDKLGIQFNRGNVAKWI